MPWPESPIGSANTDLIRLVAAAADLCRKPLRHAVVPEPGSTAPGSAEPGGPGPESRLDPLDLSLRLEARTPLGERAPQEDLELELYRSGEQLNLTLSWREDPSRPLLWHGSHPVWMEGATGRRCGSPEDGAPLEALARRLKALLQPGA